MRSYELANDEIIRPNMYVVCRIDGRNFSTLTRKVLKLAPYDKKLADEMHETVHHLMNCGFPVAFAYTQSDEISLLLDKAKLLPFNGKIRKFNSILAAEASAIMSLRYGPFAKTTVAFDCRTIQLPTQESVIDYFCWRRADSEKNCMNMWCYHIMIKRLGLTPTQAQRNLDRRRVQWKHDFLYSHGINFDTIPEWQKRGIGIYWVDYYKDAINQKTNQKVIALRRLLEKVVLPKNNEEFNLLLHRFL